MASLLRHPQCFPSTSPFSADVFPSAPAHPLHPQPFLPLPLPKSPLPSPLRRSLKSKPIRRSPLHHCRCAPSAAASALLVETQLPANDDGAAPVGKEEEEEEEFSRTRLIAQNVPWACTAEDVRSLFEKHGTVVEVEVRARSIAPCRLRLMLWLHGRRNSSGVDGLCVLWLRFSCRCIVRR